MTPPLGYDLLLPGPTPFSPANHASGLYPMTVHSKSKPGFDGGPSAPIRAHPRRSSTSDTRSLPLAESAVRLHALLEFSPTSSGDGSGPAIRWDLVDMPSLPTLSPGLSQNLRGSRRSSLSSGTGGCHYYGHQQGLRLLDLLDEPATLPPTASMMTITCPHLLWVIRVYPSSSSSPSSLLSPPSSPDSPGYASPTGSFDSSSSSFSSYVHLPGPEMTRYITVRDVLTEIYYALRAPISHSEYAQLSYERDRERAGRAYKRRYRRVLSSSAGPHHEDSSDDSRREREYEDEKKAGLRRVDFLMEKTRFGGLSRGRGPGEWVLHVE